jgi:hypothetical protein
MKEDMEASEGGRFLFAREVPQEGSLATRTLRLVSTGRPHGKYLFWRRRKKSAAVGRERKKARAKNINALYPLEDASET